MRMTINKTIKAGCILYNMSYGTENVDLMYKTIFNIIDKTPFTVADTISWKKKNALPNSVSPNRLTRICEFVYVIVRKEEIKSFKLLAFDNKIASFLDCTYLCSISAE